MAETGADPPTATFGSAPYASVFPPLRPVRPVDPIPQTVNGVRGTVQYSHRWDSPKIYAHCKWLSLPKQQRSTSWSAATPTPPASKLRQHTTNGTGQRPAEAQTSHLPPPIAGTSPHPTSRQFVPAMVPTWHRVARHQGYTPVHSQPPHSLRRQTALVAIPDFVVECARTI